MVTQLCTYRRPEYRIRCALHSLRCFKSNLNNKSIQFILAKTVTAEIGRLKCVLLSQVECIGGGTKCERHRRPKIQIHLGLQCVLVMV